MYKLVHLLVLGAAHEFLYETPGRSAVRYPVKRTISDCMGVQAVSNNPEMKPSSSVKCFIYSHTSHYTIERTSAALRGLILDC
ncbi:hypothetical protein Zmor_017765 [Zophobas morio]|uniref:Secreted protein n=1 Tax=Zophobas morio TaxID=2755281 RepID=A0AA38ID33_9CUCU|nr:hypothetical protein Zmor_017765 [Zophobas morio]